MEFFSSLDSFDTIIDVRSPSEFAEDHVPGAINCPVLSDEERVRVGTIYKQVNAFEAKKIGAALVARNIAEHIEAQFLDKPRNWKPLIYCWRGGNRSGAMAHILSQIGWHVQKLDGGYKKYRGEVNRALAAWPPRFTFQVVCGMTGSGKTRLLQVLESVGAQVLDLEKLAAHRGSVLGGLPSESQPSQKAFETRIWQLLRGFNPAQPVFVESESKKVGNLRVPEALMQKMRESSCLSVLLPHAQRVQLLMEDYAHFVCAPANLASKLDCLTHLHGHEKIGRWKQMVSGGQMAVLVDELLVHHYDPSYLRSIERNFVQFNKAQTVELGDISVESFRSAALSLHGTTCLSE
jgi:tRNA 2-selenouridine synthase